MPLKRSVLRKGSKKAINHLDIHWRNTPLLTKFINSASMIKSRIQTRLPKWQQKRVAKAIVISRTMNLLPYFGFLKSYHKIPLRTAVEDIETSHLKRVDLETGAIKFVQPSTEWHYRDNSMEEEMQQLKDFNSK